jgi:hypothetical protein
MIDVFFLRLFSFDIFFFDVCFSTYFVRRFFLRHFFFRRFHCNSSYLCVARDSVAHSTTKMVKKVSSTRKLQISSSLMHPHFIKGFSPCFEGEGEFDYKNNKERFYLNDLSSCLSTLQHIENKTDHPQYMF